MLTFPSVPQPGAVPTARPRWVQKVNHLLLRQEPNSTDFFKCPKSYAHASGAWRHLHPPIPFFIWDFYFDISEWHILPARAWTPALMLHLTNPCAKRKVLSLTKPKGKIYKTKSLGHYITNLMFSSTNEICIFLNLRSYSVRHKIPKESRRTHRLKQ